MQRTWENIAISLAGMVQAVSLVEQLAKTGYLATEEFETCLKSIFIQNPESVIEVYGAPPAIRRGSENLDKLLTRSRDPKYADLVRYSLGAMHLQRRLSKKRELLSVIGSRLEKISQQVDHFGPGHDNVVFNLAELYTDTISKFQYRIQVTGEFGYLQQKRVAAQVRALLLAAIRAATLWRQVGGSRWQLLWYRARIEEANQALLAAGKVLH